jgi:3-methyladenine DNA glycosylase AlkD
MLMEDAIAMLQLHEVPGKAAKMRAYYKVERAYWGLTTRVLDDQARQWRQELSLANRLQLAAGLWDSNAHEGRICAAKLLTQARIRPDDCAAWQLLQTWLADVDCAAICDHLCLAGHRRLGADLTRIDEMSKWPQSPHLWTRRAALAMTLPWAKIRDPNAANLAIRERALDCAAELAEDPSKIIQQGIAEWIYELSRKSPERAQAFLDAHGNKLRNAARKDASRKLPTPA